jgi:hypothetical protein
MIPVDGFYLYTLGHSIHPLREIRAAETLKEWLIPLYIAENYLEDLPGKSVFQLRASVPAGNKLLGAIKHLTANSTRQEPINPHESYSIISAVSEFEHVLNAEFGMINLYCVLKKPGYDTSDLVGNGSILFPEDLSRKAAEAIPDVEQAARCIAFDLPTAAGFHLHRANESVLHRWYDAVTKGAPRPDGRNIGDYLKKLNELKVGSDKVKSALKNLKDLHRNPLIHPQDSLESGDEAIALMESIQAVVTPMLKDIPEPAALAVVTP